MSDIQELSASVLRQAKAAILKEFGFVDLRDNGNFYGKSGMRYGYLAWDNEARECLVCDATPDMGDTIVTRIVWEPRPYYTLLIWEDGAWSPQFGDYVRSVVTAEKRDSFHGLKGHIWKCDHCPNMAEVASYVASLK